MKKSIINYALSFICLPVATSVAAGIVVSNETKNKNEIVMNIQENQQNISTTFNDRNVFKNTISANVMGLQDLYLWDNLDTTTTNQQRIDRLVELIMISKKDIVWNRPVSDWTVNDIIYNDFDISPNVGIVTIKNIKLKRFYDRNSLINANNEDDYLLIGNLTIRDLNKFKVFNTELKSHVRLNEVFQSSDLLNDKMYAIDIVGNRICEDEIIKQLNNPNSLNSFFINPVPLVYINENRPIVKADSVRFSFDNSVIKVIGQFLCAPETPEKIPLYKEFSMIIHGFNDNPTRLVNTSYKITDKNIANKTAVKVKDWELLNYIKRENTLRTMFADYPEIFIKSNSDIDSKTNIYGVKRKPGKGEIQLDLEVYNAKVSGSSGDSKNGFGKRVFTVVLTGFTPDATNDFETNGSSPNNPSNQLLPPTTTERFLTVLIPTVVSFFLIFCLVIAALMYHRHLFKVEDPVY